jgi:hypothetical protein
MIVDRDGVGQGQDFAVSQVIERRGSGGKVETERAGRRA